VQSVAYCQQVAAFALPVGAPAKRDEVSVPFHHWMPLVSPSKDVSSS